MTPEEASQTLAEEIAARAIPGKRMLVAIAGPPASGKSTIAEALVETLGPRAVLIPMDGYHLDNRLLEQRDLLARKGAPETFDAQGFITLVQRVARSENPVIPVFDRARDIAIAGAAEVRETHEIAVFEGNYLLFDDPPWQELRSYWTLAVRLDVPETKLKERLIQRWLDHGQDVHAAQARAEANDLPNARRVLAACLPADLTLQG